MATMQLSGVLSGIDFDALVKAELAANQRRINRLDTQKAELEAEVEAVNDIKGRLAALQQMTQGLDDAADLRRVRASTTDGDVAYVNAARARTEGVYTVEVNRLATSEKEVHDGLTPTETWTHLTAVADTGDTYIAAEDISAATGTDYQFDFQFGDEARVTVDLSAYDATGISLDDLVTEINTAAGYTAATTFEDTDGHHLRLAAQAAGEGKDLVVTDTDSIAAFDSTDDFEETVDGGTGTDALVGAGRLDYTYAGTTRSITTTETTTLGDLANLINDDSNNPGVTASVLEYDGGTGGAFHLVLRGNETGSDHTIAIEATTTLASFAAGTWTETQAATDSQIRVDGYPAADWIERSGNAIDDVIPGTLTLASTGTTTITLTRQTSTLKQNLANVVEAMNGIQKYTDQYTGYDADTEKSGVLQGDYFLNGIYNRIRSTLTTTAVGFDPDHETFTLAADVGLEVDRHGEWSFDSARFDEAVSEDYDAVLKLVGAVASGITDSADLQFTSADESTTAGTYDVEVTYDAAGAISSARIKLDSESTYRDLTVSGNTLSGTFGNAEQYLQLTVAQTYTSATKTYQVRVRRGFAGTIEDSLEEVLDTYEGAFKAKLESYTNTKGTGSLDMIENRIDTEEQRLADLEERLNAKYARLEQTLAEIEGLNSAYQSLFSSLQNSQSGSGTNSG